MTHAQIARALGLSRVRVQQIEAVALHKFRRALVRLEREAARRRLTRGVRATR